MVKHMNSNPILPPLTAKKSLECSDDSSPIRLMVEVEARRLGEDTGRNILFDVGSQLTNIYGSW